MSVALLHPAKAVGQNEMPFGRDTRVSKKYAQVLETNQLALGEDPIIAWILCHIPGFYTISRHGIK